MVEKSPAEALKMQYVNGLITRERYTEMLSSLVTPSASQPPVASASPTPTSYKEMVYIPPVSSPKSASPPASSSDDYSYYIPPVYGPSSAAESATQSKRGRQEEINEQIRKSGAGGLLTRKEINELPHILWEDETVEKIVSGYYNGGTGILVASNKRLIFIDKGLLYGLRVEDFPYDRVTSIQYKTGLALGDITIFASGNNAVIQNVPKGDVKPFSEYVRARITAISLHASAPPTPLPPQEDMFTKLERLAALRDKGILSDEEFNQQKAKILNQ